MSIERLRALEKELREEERQQLAESRRHAAEGNDETVQAFCNGKAFGLNAAAQRIATLIAELGQEVGAVAMPLTEDEHEWLMYAVDHMLDDSEPEDKTCARVLQGLLDRCVVTSPARTSEARDCPAQFFASGPQGDFFASDSKFANHLILVAGYDRDDWTVTDLYAAMRQEGGSDA